MTSDPSAPDAWGPHLSTALREIRRARGLTTEEVARRMGMPRRSYAFFEAGRGRLNIERIFQFAHVTDSDPCAIFASVLIGSPSLALRMADNKLLTAFLILLREFDSKTGDEIVRLTASAGIAAFSAAFKSLAEAAVDRREASSQDWLRAEASKLGLLGAARNAEDP